MIKSIMKKSDIHEPIDVGDLLIYNFISNKVTKATIEKLESTDSNQVIGVCIANNENSITYSNQGAVIVNVCGLVCLGDKLTLSDIPGKATAIKYVQDTTKFGIRGIGKVIELFNDYSKAKVLLDIE